MRLGSLRALRAFAVAGAVTLLTMAPAGLTSQQSTATPSLPGRSSAAPEVARSPSDRPTVLRLTPADGRLLLAEAMANPGEFSVVLDPGPRGLYVGGGKIVLTGTAQGPYAASCPIRMWGTPVIQNNQLALTGLTIVTDGYVCQAALNLAEARVKSSITSHPWDLAARLSRASRDPNLPGPRLPNTGCLHRDRIHLQSVAPRGQDLEVRLTVEPGGCF